MDTLTIVLIVLGALLLIALIAAAMRKRSADHERELEDRRVVATEHREEATSRRLSADREGAAAEEQAARARREAAEAEERARVAERERETAGAHEEHASEIDPDAEPEREDTTAYRDSDRT